MKRCFSLAVLLAAMSGCKMKEFSSTPFYMGDEVKYVGKPEDRVNLWPLAYWREPVGSVLWPLISFGDDHFALRPLYSQYGRGGEIDEYNVLWPIGQFRGWQGDNRLFPFFWGESHFIIFPEVWWTENWLSILPFGAKKDFSEGIVLPFAFWNFDENLSYTSIVPLFSCSSRKEDVRFWAAAGLCGYRRQSDEEPVHWFLPFYLRNRRGFYSLPFSRVRKGETASDFLLGGVFGRTSLQGTYESSWLFPFYYHDADRFITPLYGITPTSDWLMPLYYRGEAEFHSALYSYMSDAGSGRCSFLSVPLLFTFASWQTNGNEFAWSTLCGLVGANTAASGDLREHWMFPLFHHEKGRSFTSLPYGWSGGGTACTNTWWATPLVGTWSGCTEGGWVFPVFSHRKDVPFEELAQRLDAKTLPPDITIWSRAVTNTIWNAETKKYDREKIDVRFGSNSFRADDKRTYVLLFDSDDSVSGGLRLGSSANRYEMVRHRKNGNRLVFNSEWRRTVHYDPASREQVGDMETDTVSLLLLLYSYESSIDRKSRDYRKQRRVLWKLWDWEEENGDISLDVFPGFTYDSKTNGYTKSSFLWRLFRYENDPQKGTAVDCLFVPIWR